MLILMFISGYSACDEVRKRKKLCVVDGQYERCACGHFGIEDEAAVDFFGTQSADGESESVTVGNVAGGGKCGEERLTLVFGNARS